MKKIEISEKLTKICKEGSHLAFPSLELYIHILGQAWEHTEKQDIYLPKSLEGSAIEEFYQRHKGDYIGNIIKDLTPVRYSV